MDEDCGYGPSAPLDRVNLEPIEVFSDVPEDLVGDRRTVQFEHGPNVLTRVRATILYSDDDHSAAGIGDRGQVLDELDPLPIAPWVEPLLELNELGLALRVLCPTQSILAR
jgi:hypothetical protein